MNETIERTKKIIKEQVDANKIFMSGEAFSKYQKVYFNTNENIKGYLSDISGKYNALTVLASGDHVLNLIYKDIFNIDSFDSNLLTEFYVFGIRYAMISKYNYKDYLSVLSIIIGKNTSLELITTIIEELLPYMDNKYRLYWKSVNEYNYKLQSSNNTNLNIFYLLTLGIGKLDEIILRNSYLLNENNYNKLKTNLFKTNISFKNIDAFDLKEHYKNKYDLILMSNIFDYMYRKFGMMYNYRNIEEYVNILESMLREKGILYLNYIYSYSINSFDRKYIMDYSNVKKEDIKNSLVLKIDSYKGYEKAKDGVILIKTR